MYVEQLKGLVHQPTIHTACVALQTWKQLSK